MPASHICAGCGRVFPTIRGYLSHLRQTHNVLCRQVYDTIRDRKASPHDSDSSESPSEHSNQRTPSPAGQIDVEMFPGDFFGPAADYANDNFGQNNARDNALDINYPGPENGQDSEEDVAERELAEMAVQLEVGWEADRINAPQEYIPGPEPPLPGVEEGAPSSEGLAEATATARSDAERVLIGDGHGLKPKVRIRYSDNHPLSQAGQPLSRQESADAHYSAALSGGDWAPFKSRMDWEVAHWAKLRGAGSTSFSDLLSIDGVREALDLSYKNSEELNRIIDADLPGRPQFHRREVVVQGEAMEFYCRDILECLKALWGDADFAEDLIFQPERHYADDDEVTHLYHGMETGTWWWKTQKDIEIATKHTKCTIVPVIISSDKTQLTQFRNKSAYPVYMTIGNLPKHIRRKPSCQGQVLLAYLPTSRLEHITNCSSRRRCIANLFHHCMKHILQPLEHAGRTGVVFTSGDGAARCCFPIYSVFVGDYPEQVLVTLVKSGRCPICPAERAGIGSLDSVCPPRDIEPIQRALRKIKDGPTIFTKACNSAGIKPIQDPFWLDLPYLNIYESITPDILHQVYQGVFKHVLSWIYAACGEAEIDARCRRLPPNHNIHLFMKGITHLSRVTGTEHDQISRFILGLLVDIRLPDGVSNARLVRAVRSLLDFIYLAKFPIHSTQTLDSMDEALRTFQANLDIFVELGICEHFDIPKFHFTGHYRAFVELYGTTDNFNMEYTERLHIEMAKDAYAATNCKDEYSQMTLWLEHQEKILQHEKYIQRRFTSRPDIVKPLPSLIPKCQQHMMKHPTVQAVTFDDLHERYGASQFETALARFVAQYQHLEYTKVQIDAAALGIHLPFYRVPVFHRLKFWSNDVYALDPLARQIVDSIHVEPARQDKYRNIIPGRFDIALINVKDGGPAGVKGYCAAQVRCIFSLPHTALARWFPQGFPHQHLAYVEWYTPFSTARFDPNSKLYRISPLMLRSTHQASIVPIALIHESLQLFPKFGPIAPTLWKSSNVLDMASIFYVNPFSDRFQYSTVY